MRQRFPLRDGDDARLVNWCALTTTAESGYVLYHNTVVTNLARDARQVLEVVAAGRGRWQIENENNNLLKTKDYHFEHT